MKLDRCEGTLSLILDRLEAMAMSLPVNLELVDRLERLTGICLAFCSTGKTGLSQQWCAIYYQTFLLPFIYSTKLITARDRGVCSQVNRETLLELRIKFNYLKPRFTVCKSSILTTKPCLLPFTTKNRTHSLLSMGVTWPAGKHLWMWGVYDVNSHYQNWMGGPGMWVSNQPRPFVLTPPVENSPTLKRRERWIFDNRGVILTLIHWLKSLFFPVCYKAMLAIRSDLILP